ncbi:MAG TPA: hypothetical protein VFU41_15920 [Gemmatimonadales bacterium]|nr:hypothetical protein [Gemmatimonadales bacterium]
MCVGPDGTVYVTDTGIKAGPPPGGFAEAGTDALYQFGPGGRAVAVAHGKGRRTDLPKPPKGQLDGVERLADGSFLISSWEGQAIYRLSGGTYTTAVDSVPSPADIGYDAKRAVVLIPIFMENKIEVREVK